MPNPAQSILVPFFVGILFLLLAFWLQRKIPLFKQGMIRLLFGFLIVLCSICVLFSLLEAGWYFFHAASDNNNRTLASKRWFDKYWKPINCLGFRDIEHQGADYSGRKVLYLVGDSFTAGQGIEDAGDRYTDILRDRLGDEWAVINVAKLGWNTYNEYQAINGVKRTFGIEPDLVVLAYFVNDIMDYRYVKGLKTPLTYPGDLVEPYPAIIEWTKRRSYFINYLYWAVFRLSYMQEYAEKHWNAVVDAYKDEGIWGRHQKDLLDVIKRCEDFGASLMVMVFPHLADLERSKGITAQVADLFREHDVPVFDLSVLLDGRDCSELKVSRLDNHPNEILNREIAEMLLEEIGKWIE